MKFILNQLHKELKDDIINQNGFKSTKFGTKREYNEFNYENEKSIITELFQIESTKITQCLNENINNAYYTYHSI